MTYRGVRIGRVDKLELTEQGVDVYLDIDNSNDEIPEDAIALVGNRSAVGEQYVELQPQTDEKPYLEEGSEIAEEDTRLPIQTDQLLTDISNTVSSVDQEALRTTVAEMGEAFAGTGEDLQQIIDTGNSFIEAADDELRRHHGPDRGLQHRAERADRLGERAAHLRVTALGLQRGASPPRTATCATSSTPARSPPTSCAASSRTTGSSSASWSATWPPPAR